MKKRKAKGNVMVDDIKNPKDRKRFLGNPYAVADYKAVNPDFGTMKEFKALINEIHRMGMYAIIDWVPNHTGWDHPWISAHPEWYTQDKDGNIMNPPDNNTGKSWKRTDLANLNFDQSDMRKEMIKDMKFWLKKTDIDGFRMDLAHGVPTNFWDEACPALMQTKPCFLLAEAEVPYLLNSGNYHMDYASEFHHLMNKIAKGKENVDAIDAYLTQDKKKNTKGYHMHFTSNHDENSWLGTEFERMEDSHKAFAVLTATFDGMPLIYSGQEEPLKKRLKFFEKDDIEFEKFEYTDFYKTLLHLKHQNKALWNGDFGGKLQRIATGNDSHVFAFLRKKDGDKVVVLLNLSEEFQDIKLEGENYVGTYNNVFANSTIDLSKEATFKLNPWGYIVLSNK